MPRRKITIEDAFAALESAGIHVAVRKVIPEPVASAEQDEPEIIVKVKRNPYGKQKPIGNTNVRIMLYAQHSIGNAGNEAGRGAQKHIEGSGIHTYGPGYVTVPRDIAAHLQHADYMARKADERLLDRTERCFLIVERKDSSGNKANVATPVRDLDMANILLTMDAGLYPIG